jgi:GT2 family glycosyltransferase
VFRATGGFDPSWRQSEDVEWSWRAQLAGFRLGFAPEAVVQYRYRRSAAAVVRQGFRMGYAAVRLQHRFAPAGLRRPPRARALRRWAWVCARAPLVLSPARRGVWLRRFGEACGHLAATVRFRTLSP